VNSHALIWPTAEFGTTRPRLPLDGTWEFSYDPGDLGRRRRWFDPERHLPERITIPGCSQARRYASARGHVRDTDVAIPELSNTIMLRHGCLHPSWYRRSFVVPAGWKGRAVHLHVGGVKPAAEFWLNGAQLGSTLTSRSPVRVDLTRWVEFGHRNTLTVRIGWPGLRLDGVLDVWHAWSGLYRSAWVEAVPAAWLAAIHVRTSIRPAAADVAVRVCPGGGAGLPAGLKAVCELSPLGGGAGYAAGGAVSVRRGEGRATVHLPMPGAALWSPKTPNLYRVTVRLFAGGTLLDAGTVRFGLRELAVRGLHVLLNGTPVFLRGGCDDRVYPLTVCPPADPAFYRDQIRKARAFGFNYAKSCVDVFTREYLDAADELGYLVCQEMPFGVQGKLRALREHPTPEAAALWRRELENIVTADRNHPSVVLYSMASELPVQGDDPLPFRLFCREFPRTATRCWCCRTAAGAASSTAPRWTWVWWSPISATGRCAGRCCDGASCGAGRPSRAALGGLTRSRAVPGTA
jgi:beta-galactosidase/beta-glucuronidase